MASKLTIACIFCVCLSSDHSWAYHCQLRLATYPRHETSQNGSYPVIYHSSSHHSSWTFWSVFENELAEYFKTHCCESIEGDDSGSLGVAWSVVAAARRGSRLTWWTDNRCPNRTDGDARRAASSGNRQRAAPPTPHRRAAFLPRSVVPTSSLYYLDAGNDRPTIRLQNPVSHKNQ